MQYQFFPGETWELDNLDLDKNFPFKKAFLQTKATRFCQKIIFGLQISFVVESFTLQTTFQRLKLDHKNTIFLVHRTKQLLVFLDRSTRGGTV